MILKSSEMMFNVCLSLILFQAVEASSDPSPLTMPGHVTVGVLTELRQSSPDGTSCRGPIKAWALQEVAALEWALETINNQSSDTSKAGLKVFDSCGDHDRMVRQANNLHSQQNNTESPLIGVIALGSSALVSRTADLFHAYSIPLLITHAPDSPALLKADNVFTTAPHLHAQMEAVLAVIKRHRKYTSGMDLDHRLGVISGCAEALKILSADAVKNNVEIHSTLHADPDKSRLANDTMEFLKSQVGFQGTMVVLLNTDDINTLSVNLDRDLVTRAQSFWVFSVLDGEPAEGELKVEKMRNIFTKAVVVEPYSPFLPGLSEHLISALNTNQSVVAPLLGLMEEAPSKCQSENGCQDGQFPHQLLSGTRATAAVKAASSLAAAFRIAQIDKCPSNSRCDEPLTGNINKEMVRCLMKLSYNAQGSPDVIRYTADGRFDTSFTISKISSFGLQQVGKFREMDTGVIWTQPLPGMRTPQDEKSPTIFTYALQHDPYHPIEAEDSSDLKESKSNPIDYMQLEELPENDGIIKEILLSHQDNMSRVYALILLIWSSVGILSSLYIGVYVILRYCDGTIVGPQMLGGLLLFGVVCVFGSCIVFIFPPTSMACILRAVLPNITLALCFSVLLIKAMQLRFLAGLGVGGEIPQANFYITLIIMVGAEVAITFLSHEELLEGTAHPSPLVELDSLGMRHCRREPLAALLTQDYLLILLLFGLLLGVTNRKIQRNHNEGRWLFLASFACTPCVLTRMLMSFLGSPELEIGATCGCCLLVATAILGFVFIPKMKIIANQARDFRHKRLSAAASLSTIFTQMDPPQALQPPPPFCDPPLSCTKPQPDISDSINIRQWREFQESPAYQRPPAPPPPPPPVTRNPRYYNTNVWYP